MFILPILLTLSQPALAQERSPLPKSIRCFASDGEGMLPPVSGTLVDVRVQDPDGRSSMELAYYRRSGRHDMAQETSWKEEQAITEVKHSPSGQALFQTVIPSSDAKIILEVDTRFSWNPGRGAPYYRGYFTEHYKDALREFRTTCTITWH